MMIWIVSILGAYLIGSIPFGVLIGRARGVDVQAHGSGNIGATNVGRLLGRRLGALCFVLDFAKGAAPVIAAGVITDVINRDATQLSSQQMWLWLAVAAAAVLGHMFSPWLGFGGGKGVATAFGAMAGMWPLLTVPALVALVVWYLVVRLTKYVAIASMAAVASLPFSCLLWNLSDSTGGAGQTTPLLKQIVHASPPIIVTAALAVLVIFKHRSNIARLRRGEEPQVGGMARRGAVINDDADLERSP